MGARQSGGGRVVQAMILQHVALALPGPVHRDQVAPIVVVFHGHEVLMVRFSSGGVARGSFSGCIITISLKIAAS
jgi:hypothetical protein